MIKYDNIFFDLDGPILDGKLRHYNCYKDIVTKMSGRVVDIEEYWTAKRNGNNRAIIENESLLSGKYEEFIAEWIERIETKEYLKFDVLKPEIQATLIRFKAITKNLILITLRNNRDNLDWQLERYNIKKLFDKIIVCAQKEGNSKYEELENMNLGKSLLIGDTEIDIEAANMTGIDFIGIANGLRTEKIFQKNVYYDEVKDILI